MAINIGPKIGIDGEAQFRKEINNIVQQAKTLQSEMKAVTSAFDKDTDSQEKLEAQTRILNEQIKVQDQRVELLQKGVEAAADEFGKGATQTLKWEQALNEAKSTLNGLKSNLSNLENGVEDVTEELKDGEQASFGFGDALKSDLLSGTIIEGVKGLAGSLSDLTESTKEYRKIMASLDVSSENAGYTAEETTEIYKTLYGVLGDNQTAATTTANLQAIGLEQEQLTEITNGAIGAWATYGDSIPIDSLAESINETIQAGTVTGTFADVLNWASLEGETFGVALKENTEANEEWNKAVEDAVTAEDYFNLALQDAADSTERAQLVLDLLSSEGLPDAGKAWQDANDDIVDANKATSDFEDITADLSKKFSPISTSLQEGFNEIAEAALDMVDDSDIDEFSDIIADVADFIADEVMPVIKNLFDFIIDNKDTILRVVEGIGAGFATWKSAEVVSKVSGYIKNLATNATNASGPMGILNSLWQANPAAVVATSVGLLTTALGLLYDAVTAQTEEEKLLQEQYEKREEILDELKTSYDNTKESAYNTAGAEIEHLDSVQKLYDELTTLADETGKVTDKDKERADFILNELNEALGTEYTLTGNQIDQYKTMQDEIVDLINMRKAEALVGAQEEVWNQALKDRQEAEKIYLEAYNAYINEKKRLDNEYNDFYKTVVDLIGAENEEAIKWNMDNYRELHASEYENLNNMALQWQEYEGKIKGYNEDIQLYNQVTEELFAGNTEKVIDLLENRNGALITAGDVAGETAEEQTRILQEQYDAALEDLAEYEAGYKKGLEGYSETGLEIMQKMAEDAKKEMEKAGKNTSQGFSNGINESMGLVISAGQNLANKLISVVKNNLGIRSPSRIMKELGQYTGEGFEIGLDESMKDAVTTLQRDLDASAAVLSNVQPFSVPVGFGNPAFVSSNGRSVSYGDFSVVVNAAPGMDENALADVVAYKLQTQLMQKEAVFR